MYITDLTLKNFRNYGNQDISFDGAYNVIYGRNAQGKTNILEAVFLCSTGRSHRTNKDIEMINCPTTPVPLSKCDKNTLRVELTLNKKNRENIRIEVEINANGKKGVKINGIPIKRIGEMMGYLNVVIFSPEDVVLAKEEPQCRRRFLDMFISQVRPSYFFCLQQYNKGLRQRNALLKQAREDPKLLDTLDAWNAPIVQNGARIMAERRRYIDELGGYAEKNHSLLTSGAEVLNLHYCPSVKISGEDGQQGIEKKFKICLQNSKEIELVRHSTQFGPHRDDMSLRVNGNDLKKYGSQGQHRTAALALKMAQVDVMEAETGDTPVLLLDDVMSELDKGRRTGLSKNMKKTQTIATCTDSDVFEQGKEMNARLFMVESGGVKIV